MSGEITVFVRDDDAFEMGDLKGIWIDPTEPPDHLQMQVDEMLAESPGLSGNYTFTELEGDGSECLQDITELSKLHDVATLIRDHGSLAIALLGHVNGVVEEAKRIIREEYAGIYSSLEEHAEEDCRNGDVSPREVLLYVDYGKMVNDWRMSGRAFTLPAPCGGVHVFSC